MREYIQYASLKVWVDTRRFPPYKLYVEITCWCNPPMYYSKTNGSLDVTVNCYNPKHVKTLTSIKPLVKLWLMNDGYAGLTLGDFLKQMKKP